FAFALVSGVLIGLRDLILKLAGQIIEFSLGLAQGFGVVAQNAFGGALDAALQFIDALAGALLGLARLREHFLVEQFRSHFQWLATLPVIDRFDFIVERTGKHAAAQQFLRSLLDALGFVLSGLAQSVIKLFGQERLGRLGLLADAAHVL